MKLTIKQTKALDYLEDSETTELLFGGGAGGGKSALGCYWQIKKRLKYPGTRGLIGRSKLKVLKETTLQTFLEIGKMQGLKKDVHFKITSSQDKENPNSILFWNGSVIYLRDLFQYPSDKEFDDLGSLEITDAFIDECNQIVKKAKDIVKSRIRFRLDEFNLYPKLLMTCNPAKNWTYREFFNPNRKNQLPLYRKFIQSLLTDNPHISRHYKENLLTLDLNSKQRLLYGNWDYDDDPTALCQFSAIEALISNNHVQRTGVKYLTGDVARLGSDKAILKVWDGWVVIDYKVYELSKLTEIQDCINAFRIKYSIPSHHCIVDQDGLGAGVVDNCGILGFVNNATPLPVDTGDDYLKPQYNNLQSQCGYHLAEKINGFEIYFDIPLTGQEQEEIFEELGQLKTWKIDDDKKVYLLPKKEIKENIGRSPDWRDTLLMRSYFDLIHNEIEIEIYNE